MDRPVETRTITESATISLEFVIQEGSKGHYKIVRDGVTIIERSTISNSIIVKFSNYYYFCLLCCLQSGRYSRQKIYDSKS